MTLTRTIPIKNRIFSSEALLNVLEELSDYYKHGDDEDWVNLAHAKATKLLDNVEEQSCFLRKYGFTLTFSFALIVGWPLKNLFFVLLKWLGQTKQVPWSWTVLFQHLFLAWMLGLIPAAWLIGYATKAFPSIEIQTGPSRSWREARARARLKIIFAIVVLAPSANFLYDLYKVIFAT